jgi:hypothetical protein
MAQDETQELAELNVIGWHAPTHLLGLGTGGEGELLLYGCLPDDRPYLT